MYLKIPTIKVSLNPLALYFISFIAFLSSVSGHLSDLDEPSPLVLLDVQVEPLALQVDGPGGEVALRERLS